MGRGKKAAVKAEGPGEGKEKVALDAVQTAQKAAKAKAALAAALAAATAAATAAASGADADADAATAAATKAAATKAAEAAAAATVATIEADAAAAAAGAEPGGFWPLHKAGMVPPIITEFALNPAREDGRPDGLLLPDKFTCAEVESLWSVDLWSQLSDHHELHMVPFNPPRQVQFVTWKTVRCMIL
jgi:hypothetical protein